jgi:hypothetical protein
LTSSDVDGFLMQQSVMRFADDGARGSALGTAVGTGVLAQGMVAYLDDINQIQVYSGSSWTSPLPGIGSNVVQTVKTNTFSTTSTSFDAVTGLSVSITPSSDTSKVLVVAYVSQGFTFTDAGQGHQARLVRDSTPILVGNADGSRIQATHHIGQAAYGAFTTFSPFTAVIMDTPATDSLVTYSVQLRVSGGTAFVNRTGADSNSAAFGRTASSITAIEVAA